MSDDLLVLYLSTTEPPVIFLSDFTLLLLSENQFCSPDSPDCPHSTQAPIFYYLTWCPLLLFPSFDFTNLVSKFRMHTVIYLQSRCCQLAFGQVEPTHRWNYPCFELKLFLDTRKLLLPHRRLLHLPLLHHVSLLQGDPCYGCTAGCSQGVKISEYVFASLSLSFYLLIIIIIIIIQCKEMKLKLLCLVQEMSQEYMCVRKE